jgi:hypothetical protein
MLNMKVSSMGYRIDFFREMRQFSIAGLPSFGATTGAGGFIVASLCHLVCEAGPLILGRILVPGRSEER